MRSLATPFFQFCGPFFGAARWHLFLRPRAHFVSGGPKFGAAGWPQFRSPNRGDVFALCCTSWRLLLRILFPQSPRSDPLPHLGTLAAGAWELSVSTRCLDLWRPPGGPQNSPSNMSFLSPASTPLGGRSGGEVVDGGVQGCRGGKGRGDGGQGGQSAWVACSRFRGRFGRF